MHIYKTIVNTFKLYVSLEAMIDIATRVALGGLKSYLTNSVFITSD